MADHTNPLKPIALRPKSLSEEPSSESIKDIPVEPKAPTKKPIEVRYVEESGTRGAVRQTAEGIEINLEEALAESHRREKSGTGSRKAPPRLAGAPPPAKVPSADRVTEPPSSMQSPASRAPGVSTRNTFRRPCSFPGMLRVLLPEQSFEPQMFAVRVMDLSGTGARVETRQLTEDLYKILSLEPRYIRLEILIPARDRLLISGNLAWMEFQPDLSIIGISFHPERDDLTEVCLPEWRPQGTADSAFISPPVVDSYPPSTTRTPFTFTGHALDADVVVVRGTSEEHRVPVISGRFEVTIPLVPGVANELIFVALVGEMASDSTPVWIIHRADGDGTAARKAVGGLFQEAVVGQNGRHLRLKFHGDMRDLVQAVRRLEDITGFGEDFQFVFELTGDAERALSVIKKGGRFPWTKS